MCPSKRKNDPMIFKDVLDRGCEGWAFIFALSISVDSLG